MMTKSGKADAELWTDIFKKLEYCMEANRRATFKKWVFSDRAKCCAAKLAEAGFVFSGTKYEPDSVTCFFCNKSLDSWDEDDDPWTEHIKHSPSCLFAKTEKPEMSLTLNEWMDIRIELAVNLVRGVFADNLSNFQNEVDDLLQMFTSLK